jgi:ribosome recycling factor
LLIQPWDKSIVKDVDRALQEADLGVQPTVDGERIRVTLPPMTEERRGVIVKLVGERLENARVALKAKRTDLLKKLKAEEKSGERSEDDYFAAEKELQKLVDAAHAHMEELAQAKEREVRTV